MCSSSARTTTANIQNVVIFRCFRIRGIAFYCKYLNSCSFIVYGDHVAPFTSKMTRLNYCELIQDGCARYKAYQGMDAGQVPDDLRPNLEIKTLELIERNSMQQCPVESILSGPIDSSQKRGIFI